MIVWLPEKMHEACANKLLKIIEEPPSNTVFLLVSEEPNEVLPTIQSRCQPLHIGAIEENEMVDIIESKYRFSKKDASAVAHVANGSFTKAISIIESTDENRFFFDLFKKNDAGFRFTKNKKHQSNSKRNSRDRSRDAKELSPCIVCACFENIL